ncbi:MAG: cytochrome c oxidase subunit 3 [Chloroflexi bacterium]|nr:cytochrome c oxidase subunit 3 [Chloroflexota bacterium]
MEHKSAPFNTGDSALGGILYMIMGPYGMHAATGTVPLAIILVRAPGREPSVEKHLPVKTGGLHWHSADAVRPSVSSNLYIHL